MMRTFFVIAIFFCYKFSISQTPTFLRFEHITTNNGLSNNRIISIHQDANGFMWFGSEDGLNRYDGNNFKTYRHKESDSFSLPGNNIIAINEDRNNPNKLWISCHCMGLSNFNLNNGRSKNFIENIQDSTQLKSNCEIGILYDDEGNTWVKNRKHLSFFNKKNNTFKTVYTDDSSIIYSFTIQKNIIWMGLVNSVKTYNIKTGEIIKYNLSKTNNNYALYTPKFITNTGEIICGSWEMGMCIFNPVTQLKKYFFANAIISDVKEVNLYNKKQLWVATNQGLFVADINNGYASLNEKSFTCFRPNTANPYSISSTSISTIYQSNDGIIWLGTEDNGINKLAPNYLKFQQKQMSSKNNLWNTFANETPIDVLIEQENGKKIYWFNYWYGGGLMKVNEDFEVLDRINFEHENIKYKKENRSLIVSKVFRYGKDTLCIATWSGLWLYNDKQKKLLRCYKLNDNDTSQPKQSKITYAVKTTPQEVWVSTFNQQIHKLNIITGKWHHYKEGDAPNNPKYAGSSFMLLDNKKRLWFSRFYYYDFKTKQFVHHNQVSEATSMLQDNKGTIWAASDLGLMRYNENSKSFVCYTVENGLRSNLIYKIVEDDSGCIWGTSSLGLVCFNTNTNVIKTFTTTDGLPRNNTGDFLCKLSNGNLMFQYTTNTFIEKHPFYTFNPKELLIANQQLPFHFTSVRIMNNEKLFEHSLDSLQQLDINYKENFFTIHFKALEFVNNLNIQYRYKLNNNVWTELGNQDNITFTNLRGGNYLLQVQATDITGNWLKKTLQMQLVVYPPFWQTRWFNIIIALLLALIIVYLVRKRITTLKAKALTHQRLAELEMKALKAQMNPHFVFNCLSSIQESIMNNKAEAATKYLGKFSKLIRMVLMQSETKTTTLQDELNYLNLYLELESFRFEDFVYTINTNALTDIAFIKIPPMLIQPYIENAVKHGLSHKQNGKKLVICFEEDTPDTLKVIIEDNGVGRKQSAQINKNRNEGHVSMGIKITEERLQLLKERSAKIDIEDLFNEKGNATGTRVILHIPIINNL
ncbi:MAG: histidine kinase [Bacteroidetes bacterium]|nr:histidine kinase [Bacteroidota bacterium]MBS1669885.1 histidine kinase [Bacteroidota bacterium]